MGGGRESDCKPLKKANKNNQVLRTNTFKKVTYTSNFVKLQKVRAWGFAYFTTRKDFAEI